MKHVVIFFLFLFVNLVSTFGYTHAEPHITSPCASTTGINQIEQNRISTPTHPYSIGGDVNSSAENVSLFTLEDDDEDEDIIRKHLSIVRYLSALTSTFYLNYGSGPLVQHATFCDHLPYTSSCKYIVQRALRL
jgi:hypothetical protein